jgi:toxin ParE1/3/4
MKYEIAILPTAWEDLKTIEDYYLLQFDLQTSKKVVNHILDTVDKLEEFPHLGSELPDKWLNDQGYKMLVIHKRCIAIYRLIKNTIYIYHFASTRTEYRKLFY